MFYFESLMTSCESFVNFFIAIIMLLLWKWLIKISSFIRLNINSEVYTYYIRWFTVQRWGWLRVMAFHHGAEISALFLPPALGGVGVTQSDRDARGGGVCWGLLGREIWLRSDWARAQGLIAAVLNDNATVRFIFLCQEGEVWSLIWLTEAVTCT